METQQKYEMAARPQSQIVNIEDYAMSVDGLIKQVALIQTVMEKVMKSDEHYGIIPGTKKPTLLKPGAEKLCLTFRLNPDYEIIREVRERDFIAYTVKCDLSHIPTEQAIASGIGSCNSRETKYRYRFIDESTGDKVPSNYWDAKKAGDSKEMKRILGGEGFRAAKIDGQWVIARSERIENDNPWDLDNTLIKMACKRALVAATLNATAASDIFTQDVEDMNPEILTTDTKRVEPDPKPKQDPGPVKPKKERPKKEEFDFIASCRKAREVLGDEIYYTILGVHGYEHSTEISKTAQYAVMEDLRIEAKKVGEAKKKDLA